MTTRREFVVSGLNAGVTANLLISAALAARANRAFRLDRFVLDVRYPETHSVAQVMAARSTPLSSFAGDLTHVWYDDLDLRWREAPRVVAGTTAKEGLFVLERLAADRQMRVIFRAYHQPSRAGRYEHNVVGSADLVRASMRAADDHWARSLWTSLAAAGTTGGPSENRSYWTRAPSGSSRTETLVSWIMVPRGTIGKRG